MGLRPLTPCWCDSGRELGKKMTGGRGREEAQGGGDVEEPVGKSNPSHVIPELIVVKVWRHS